MSVQIPIESDEIDAGDPVQAPTTGANYTTSCTISPRGMDPSPCGLIEPTFNDIVAKGKKRSISMQSSTDRCDPHHITLNYSSRPQKMKRYVTEENGQVCATQVGDQCPPNNNNAATTSALRSSSDKRKISSLHTLAMACEITTDTSPSVNRGRACKPAEKTISQDATKPYSNLSNEWVVPSKPTGEANISPANSLSVTSPISINDVLCGRGGLTNHHPGNIFFRKLVRHNQESYLLATKRDKAGVAKGIVDTIRSLNPPGRFLKKARDISANGVWVEIGDRKAREKTSQALRERAPELRSELECHRQQQHPHPNVVSSDEKAVFNFSIGTKNSTPSNPVVGPILSNALVGPNVVLRRELACDSVTSSPVTSCANSKPILINGLTGPNVVLQKEMTCDSVASSSGINTKNPTSSNTVVEPILSNAFVGPNVVPQPEMTHNSVISSAISHADACKLSLSQLVDVQRRERGNISKCIKTSNFTPAGVVPSAIISMTPSIPCSVQANVGIRTISSAEEEICEKQQNVCQKTQRGGPRIKMLKERIQKVV